MFCTFITVFFFGQIAQVGDLFLFLVQFHIAKEGSMIFVMYV